MWKITALSKGYLVDYIRRIKTDVLTLVTDGIHIIFDVVLYTQPVYLVWIRGLTAAWDLYIVETGESSLHKPLIRAVRSTLLWKALK